MLGCGRGAAACGGEVKQHFDPSDVVFLWGKQHWSETGILQPLANVTKVTFAFF